ncbi:COX5A-domain-containing protein [Atractiella rhizophila]|nr:COX5A-domain-containing protein [Atractiella rhizophila]
MTLLTRSLRLSRALPSSTAVLPSSSSILLKTSPALGARSYSAAHAEESFEAFNARYAQFFSTVTDVFELQRGLNNCFSYDLVPSQEVVEEALKASRRVNDFSTAVRVFEGIREKVENEKQYGEYVRETEGLRRELGIMTKEELFSS